MTNKTFITIPKYNNLSYQERMKRVEELAKQQLKNKGEHR